MGVGIIGVGDVGVDILEVEDDDDSFTNTGSGSLSEILTEDVIGVYRVDGFN